MESEAVDELPQSPGGAKEDLPPHCQPNKHPSQCVAEFQTIRFFSDFDSGNLLKVDGLYAGRNGVRLRV